MPAEPVKSVRIIARGPTVADLRVFTDTGQELYVSGVEVVARFNGDDRRIVARLEMAVHSIDVKAQR